MSGLLIAIVGAIYVGIAVDQLTQGNLGLAVMYAGYAFANVGAWMLAR
jgi:hypothetical protein